jgi:hypothetical protein
MIGIVGIILEIIAAFIKATHGNASIMLWLIILGAILIGVEASFGWYRGGHTYRRA